MQQSQKENRTRLRGSPGNPVGESVDLCLGHKFPLNEMSSRIYFKVSTIAFFAILFVLTFGTSMKLPIFSLFSTHRATVLFGGDMMFDRTIRTAMQEKGGDFIFSCIDPILEKADMVVANLEGPITSQPSKSVGTSVGGEGNYTFTFPTFTASLLFAHNIRMVNLGNNHTLNFGHAGLAETKELLRAAGVRFFGDPDLVEAERVARLLIRGISFSFVNWSDWTSGKADHTVAQVRKEAESGRVVVVYTHWGEEYEAPSERMRILARQFVDAGASLVVGSHPHIVQEHEKYRDANIYYSLGNLIFDQYWNNEVRHGIMLRVVFDSKGVEHVQEIPVELGRDRRTCPIKI